MASLFAESFDHVTSVAMLTRKWSTVGTGTFVTGRFGRGQAFSLNSNQAMFKTLNSSLATLVVGASVQLSTPNGVSPFLSFRDSGNAQVSIMYTNDYRLSVYNGNNSTLLGTSNILFKPATWYYLELKVTIHNSAGTVDLCLNGTNVLSVTGVDTQNTANATANQLYLTNGSFANGQLIVDDIYVLDTTGSTNNDFLGEQEFRCSYPTSDVLAQFTRSTGATNFSNVDETQPNDDTDYNESSTVGQKDIYGLTAMSPAPATVKMVAITSTWKNAQAGSRSGRNILVSGGSTANGATSALGASYTMQQDIFDLDPNGSIAWTVSSANAATPGVEVTA